MLTELLGRLKRNGRKKDPAAAVHSATWSSTTSSNVSLVKSSKPLSHANPSGKLRPPANDANRVGDIGGLPPTNLSVTPSRLQRPGLTNLWERANETLRNDPDSEKRELAQSYAEILASELAGPESGPLDTDPAHLKQEIVAERLNARVEMLSHEQLSISVGSRELDIEPLLRNVSKHIVAARDLISSAAGADPHAALACAGGLVILTFLIRPLEQREHILRGLELTSSLICRYFAMEQVYRSRARLESLSAELARKLVLDLEQNLIKLYSNIIEFQARALCYLHRTRSTRFIRDVFRGDTWKTLIEEIERLDAHCRAFANLITDEKILTFLESHSEKVEQVIININTPQPVSFDLLRRRTALLRTLYACPYRDRKDINSERAPGTCEWFTEHGYFSNWMSAVDSKILRISADPGCGKSVLSRYLVDEILPSTSFRTTCYFFLKDDFEDQKLASIAMCCILRQLFEQNPDLMDERTLAKFEAAGDNLCNSFPSLFEMLLEASMRVEIELICIFDALDECNAEDCRQITAALSKFYMNPGEGSRLKVIITSRPYARIQRSLQKLETSVPAIHLRGDSESQLRKISGEIGVVIRHRVRSFAEAQLLEPHEIELLEQSLSNSQHRTYLWVKLALDYIEDRLESLTNKSIQAVLRSVPEKLDGLYEKILDRSANKERARKVLQIILAAFTPLSLDEISTALCIEKEHSRGSQLIKEPTHRLQSYLREICGLFVTVVDGSVYLLHETAREFLIRNSDSVGLDAHDETYKSTLLHSITLRESHLVVAKVCVWYLMKKDFDISAGTHSEWEMATYTSRYWARHLNSIDAQDIEYIADETMYLCKTALKRDGPLHTSHLMRKYRPPRWHFDIGFDSLASSCLHLLGNVRGGPLIVAIILGFDWVVSRLLIEDPQAGRQVDRKGITALWWAAWAGNAQITRLLLELYDDTDYGDIALNGVRSTPLTVAIAHKHNAVVHALLKDPRISITTRCRVRRNWTPMHYAIAADNFELFQLLLAEERTFAGWTSADFADLLMHSIKWGSAQTVNHLFSDSRFDFNSSDSKTWRTQFCQLANPMEKNELRPSFSEEERLNMMRILVETHQVDFARSDRGGRSPVSWAASRPANAVILTYLLDELNLEPDTLDRQGRSPLSYSAEIYCYRNIDALLRTGKVNINSVDNEGRTPLMKATQLQFRAKVTKRNPSERKYKMLRGSAAIATLRLLDHAPDVNLQDVEGNTALINAAQNRVVEGVRALIRHGADVNVQDIHGRTALAHAAEKLCFESVEALLLKAGADAKLCDDEGRSPLWLATESMNHLLPRYDIHGKMENMRGVVGLLQSSKGEDGGLKSHGRGEDLVRNHTCEEGLIKVV
ncbi:hypothetical protein CABS03_11384 [Colletotrichum abscissum]|uniref:Ankyrin repeat protein n=1 Tax=Colletotrichum abscissum TaxID=1671311 RepID=A0A9P9XR87_9PEZI|nr:hypothetical protein CABS02_00890 [Colletotrichum abscissum]